MRLALVMALLSAPTCASALVVRAMRTLTSPLSTIRASRPHPHTGTGHRANFATACAADDYDHHQEVDALDTSDSWEDQLAEQQRWKSAQDAAAAPPPMPDEWGVDEEAHYDLGADSDDEWTAAELLDSVQRAAIGARVQVQTPDRTQESLKAVISQLARLEAKLDALTESVQKMAAAPAAAPAGPAAAALATPVAPEWNGEVGEAVYFDDDAEDEGLEDWRVRRARNQLKQQGLDGTWPPKLD